MRESIRLGHIAGVRVGLNWSLPILAVLLATGLAKRMLCRLHRAGTNAPCRATISRSDDGRFTTTTGQGVRTG